jgi:nucleoside-diphosphate-sugar epimerase
MKEKVLVTGAQGFIGKHLVSFLRHKGYEVHAFDRNLDISTQFERVSPDHVIHLAAYGNHYDQKDDGLAVVSNVLFTTTILHEALKYPIKSFINVSSSSVYGVQTVPMKENMRLDCDTIYGATKAAAEHIARAFSKKYDAPVVNVRPFSVFGPGEAEHRFTPTVTRCISSGEKFNLSASPKHDWIYAEDFCEALLVIMQNIQKLKGDAINVGMGEQFTNAEIVEKIEWIMDKKANFNLVDTMRDYDTTCWVSDNTKLKELGWKPKYDIMRGLKRTVNVKSYVYE